MGAPRESREVEVERSVVWYLGLRDRLLEGRSFFSPRSDDFFPTVDEEVERRKALLDERFFSMLALDCGMSGERGR